MKSSQSITIYLLVFLAFSIFLKLFGIIDVEGSEILGYLFIFFGISIVYLFMGKRKSGIVFTGTAVFLVGIVLFLLNNFDFPNPSELIFPSTFFIVGISSFMVFVDDSTHNIFLPISIILLLFGLIFTFIIGSLSFNSFTSSFVKILMKYWPVAIILVGLLFLLWERKK